MNIQRKLAQLRWIIANKLTPLIDRDYRLLEIPDYPNIGDVLIFQGELNFLASIPYRCNGMSTMMSFAARLPKISEDELLIFSGGGFFGDIWPAGPAFKKKIFNRYPRNPKLILPQSVCFRDMSKLRESVELYSKANVLICLRDRQSYEFVKKHFRNPAYLVPDMAFAADLNAWESHEEIGNRDLMILRDDDELGTDPSILRLQLKEGVCVSDWPSFKCHDEVEAKLHLLQERLPESAEEYDEYVKTTYRNRMMALGCSFINPYRKVYSTRLHGGILGLLKNKQVSFIDNVYGKISSLYETWLRDCDCVAMLSHEEVDSLPDRKVSPQDVLDAFQDRSRALSEKCMAEKKLVEAWKVRDTVVTDRDAAYAKLAEVWRAHDAVVADRDAAYAKLSEAWQAHDAVAADRDAAYAQVAEAWKAHDAVAADRDAAYAKLSEAWKAHDAVAADRDAARRSLASLSAQLQTATNELSEIKRVCLEGCASEDSPLR